MRSHGNSLSSAKKTKAHQPGSLYSNTSYQTAVSNSVLAEHAMHMPGDHAPFRPIWHDKIGLETRRQHPAANVTRQSEEAKKGRGGSPHTYIQIHTYTYTIPTPRRHAHCLYYTPSAPTTTPFDCAMRTSDSVTRTSEPRTRRTHSSEPKPGEKRGSENEHKHA